MGKQFLSMSEVADLAGISRQRVDQYFHEGRLRAESFGGFRYVAEQDAVSFADDIRSGTRIAKPQK